MSWEICFYPGCSYDTAAGYQESANAVCDHLNIRLKTVPDWICCGSTAFFSLRGAQGALPPAKVLALAASTGADSLVTGCNGCFNTLRKAQKLMQKNHELQLHIQESLKQEGLQLAPDDFPVRHLLEVLARDVPPSTWNLSAALPQLRVASYCGCLFSRPWTDVDDPENPVLLDNFIQGLGFTPVDNSLKAACCGAAHAMAYPEYTEMLVERILRAAQDRDAEVLATICPLCQLNVESAQLNLGEPRLPVLFFTQLAGLGLGLPREKLGLEKLLIQPDKF